MSSIKAVTARVLMILFWCITMPAMVEADDRAFAKFQEGLKLEEQLKVFEACSTVREAIRLDPANAGYREHYAWYLHFNGFAEEAVAAFSDALALKPGDPSLTKGKAWNLKVIGRLQESLALYRTQYNMKSADSDIASAAREITRLLSAENETKIVSLREQLKRSPDEAQVAKELFLTLGYQGRLSEAQALGDTILARFPRDLPFRLDHARALAWSGQRKEAEEAYQSLLKFSSGNPFLMLEYGQLLADDGKLDQALTVFEQARALQPESPRLARAQAEALARLGKKETAVATADTVEDKGTNGLERAMARARSRHFSGMLNEAIREYSVALTSYPYHPELLWGLAECSTYAGLPDRTADAVAAWKTAAPDDARIGPYEQRMKKAAASHLMGQLQHYANSSDFVRTNAGLSTEARLSQKLSLIAGASVSRFEQSGYHEVYRESLSAGMHYRPVTGVELTGSIGGNLYDRGDDSVIGMAGVVARFEPGWHLAVSWERMDIVDTEPVFGNAIYNHVVTMGSVGSRTRSNEYNLYLQRDLLSGRLVLNGKLTVGDYSDGNLKLSRYGGFSYRLSDTPRLTTGYQYFALDYREPAPTYNEGASSTSAYYDPINFEVHTLFLDASHQLSKTIRAGIEQRVSYIPKSNGSAYALFGNLEAELSPTVSATLTYRFFYQNKGIERAAESGHFRAQELLAGIVMYF